MSGEFLPLRAARWVWSWTDPLSIARKTLWHALRDRAHHARGVLLDVGCGSKPYRPLFEHVERYIGMDLPAGWGVDVRADAQALPFRDGSFDTVLCNQVLEHLPQPERFFGEAARVLRPGGVLLLTTPQTWGLHLEPYDFFRFTHYGLRALAERNGFEVLEVGPTCGLWATCAQRVADTVAHTYCTGGWEWLRRPASFLMAPMLLCGYLADRCCGRRGDTLDNLLVAQQRGQER